MFPAALSISDQQLYKLLSGAAPATIPDVISRMQAMDALLPTYDGIKWFNRLYLMVTQQVDANPPAGRWQSPDWLTRLDVVFAEFYFKAVFDFLAGEDVAEAWSALFEARYRAGIDRIQFALAGMNAHINHDLALALIEADTELKMLPSFSSPEHADYQAVNDLLATVTPAALEMLATDTLGMLAEDTGKIGRLLALLDIRQARDLAWDFSCRLRCLSGIARDVALNAQDAATGALGRALLLGA